MDYISITVIMALLLLTYLYVDRNNNKKRKLINEFPGPRIYPLIGTPLPILWMKKYEIFQYFEYLAKRYGSIYRTWIGNTPSVHMTDPELVELILNNSVHITKGFGYKFILPWLGDGLLLSSGSKWHRHRKLLTPTFHFNILESFVDIFIDKSTYLVKLLAKEANGKPFNIFPYITRCALDIISETAMGIQINAMSEHKNEYVDAVYGACEEILHRVARVWLNYDSIYYRTARGKAFSKYLSTLHGTTNRVINERKQLLHEKRVDSTLTTEDDIGKKKRKAFLDLLLEAADSEAGRSLTHKQIREEVDTFMFEGHDTTTASICWTIFLLGLHPNIQETTYEEVCQVLSDDKPLEISDLNNLKYLERVIKESLRLYPSVRHIGRLASQDIKIGNKTIPVGTSVVIHIYDIHRNQKHFPNPEKFDPDRFLPENSKNRHPYAYIPFSAGPRNCIGQKFALYEEKTVLAHIIKNYVIRSMQTTENVLPVSDLIIKPHEGLFVTLEKRPNCLGNKTT